MLGDCLAIPRNLADWLTDSNISTAVNQAAASPTQPPYNFVYLHTCNSADTTGFANDFGIPGASSGDRAMIGFGSNEYNNTSEGPSTPLGYAEDGELAVNSQNTWYTQTLWQQLLAGNYAYKAIAQTLKTTQGGAQEYYEPTQQGQQGFIGVVNSEVPTLMAGSGDYTLANSVYKSGVPGQWFQ